MDVIKILVDEHDNILRMLDVIHKASLSILAGTPVEIGDFRKIIEFIRKYADKTHHGKEEEFLFKAMTNELGTIAENLVNHGMMVEHDIARLYVSDLESALDAYEQMPGNESRLAILVAAGSYEQLLRRHIQKENDVVFPFGEKQLSEQSLDWVQSQVQSFEENSENTSEREHQLEVLNLLERQ